MPALATLPVGRTGATLRPPVPTPLRYHWRHFRAAWLPAIIFGASVLGIARLWRDSAAAPTAVAEAEASRLEIGATHAGRVASLNVVLLQPVKKGEVLGRIAVVSPEVAEASLAVIRAELELLRQGLAPATDHQRVTLDYFRLQLDWMRERVALASLRVRAQQAEADLRRTTALHAKNLVSEEDYDAAVALHRRLLGQLEEQTTLVEQLTPTAQRSNLPAVSIAEAIAAGISVQEQKLRLAELQQRPQLLEAPFDGVITGVHRHEGETVAAGQTILTVVAPHPSRLVAYLRQPLSALPRRDLPVEVRTRSSPHQTGWAKIVEVGHAFEPMPATLLALVNRAGSPELGLRVHVSVPPGLTLHPGEQVDVRLAEPSAPADGR